jgi:signal peptidase II
VDRKYLIPGVTVPSFLIIDQITKLVVASTYDLYESSAVIPGLFSITYIRNPGAAFGFLAGANPAFRSIFFTAVSMVAVVLIALMLRKIRREETGALVGLSLILSGALGNLIDRIRLGEVIDFLDVYIGSYHWPAFNMADSAISIGALLFIMGIIRKKSLFD